MGTQEAGHITGTGEPSKARIFSARVSRLRAQPMPRPSLCP